MESQVKNDNRIQAEQRITGLDVMYFADPLCCWSWGFQPQLDALVAQHGERLKIQYVMGGMLPSWERFHDEVHAVSRPAQMGPVWMHAAQLTGRPIDYLLWMKNPPESSYPACIAVKAAELISREYGILYFRRVQVAAMSRAKNIATWPVLLSVAEDIANENPRFDIAKFKANYEHEASRNAFRADLELVARYKVTRFPSLLIKSEGGKAIMISGYRTADTVTAAIAQAFGGAPFNQEPVR